MENDADNFSKIKNSSQEMSREVRERVAGYIVAAFGLVAGLAWNEAIRSLINYIFPLDANSILAKFIYAILISIIAVIASFYLMKIIKREGR